MEIDALELAKKLIARRSVTPDDAGCLDMVIDILRPLGFKCEKISANGVDNLWARRGTAAPLICFAGHT
ncbi:MAG TPA: succinyl-diaminopimelate desuccinylase, partial [Burkholderiales bacterium]|nr:succinyl-diaminopimelate desuccinylase [Burkholderiales bacterium]